jgi:hypothetical protein
MNFLDYLNYYTQKLALLSFGWEGFFTIRVDSLAHWTSALFNQSVKRPILAFANTILAVYREK